jgi:glycosyltransferase involved in cell wall biosynthesis
LIIVLLRGKKPVLSPRGTLSEYSFQHRNSWIKKTFQRLLGKYLFKNTYLHCTSSMELEQSTHFFQWSGIDIIPNHVALPQITEGHGHQETGNKIELLFLSRIDPIKGIHYLLEALSKVNFRFHLTIAGSGDSEYVEQLKQQAVELGVHQSVSWIGFVRGKEKHDLFLQHDLLVLTSETENFGNVIIESLSVGTPVLISKNVGLSDYVEEHDLGWICSLEVDDIVNQLQAAYHDKVKRQHIKRKAYLIVREDFAPESLTHRYVSYYMHTLQKTPNWLKAV